LSSSKYKIDIPTITKIRTVPKTYQSMIFSPLVKTQKKVWVMQTMD
jgi:hypothetical protein